MRIKCSLLLFPQVWHAGMMEPPKPRPGDLLLDQCFPDADEQTREAAREAFRQYGLILVRLGMKIEQEMLREQLGDSSASDDGVIL